jgi:D-threo-aldose 1-dehydrogenase
MEGRLGRSAVEVTAMGLGTAQLGDLYEELDQGRATAIVDAAWDVGIRYFDTAPHYGLGQAERRLGLALAGRDRADFVVSSKVGRIIEPDADGSLTRRWDFSESGVLRSLDESLTRLGLDRIDIALIHDPQDHLAQAIDEAYPALAKLRDEGVVGAIGVGTGALPALEAFARNTEIDAMMIAGRYTLLEQPALVNVVPACVAAGISILNAGIFNSGLLATDYPGADSHYEYGAVPTALLARARRIAGIARHHGISLPQAALAFAARVPAVASIVVGAESATQVSANAALFEAAPPMNELWTELATEGLLMSTPS